MIKSLSPTYTPLNSPTALLNHRLPLWLSAVLLVFGMTFSNISLAENTLKPIKVGVLKFGTVNWELNVIKHHELDKKHGIDLEIVPLAGKESGHVAIQGGSVDVIVSDWIWVSRQRSEKRDFTFVPYSNAVGSLMVQTNKGINTLADMKGKTLGVAGGSLDKTWLLLRAYSQKTLGNDLADKVDPKFAAPPLLNKLALRGELDGAINFWHFAARLKAAGLKPLLTMPDMLKTLGVNHTIPLIGWVFKEQWAGEHSEVIKGFLQASRDAKDLLKQSDEEWDRIRPKMKAKDDAIFTGLREAFRTGIPDCFGKKEQQASATTFAILAKLGGKKLAGDADTLTSGTFWDGFDLGECKTTEQKKD